MLALVLSLAFSGEQVTQYRSELLRTSSGAYYSASCWTTVRLDGPYIRRDDPVTFFISDFCGSRSAQTLSFPSLAAVNPQRLADALCSLRESRAARPCGSAPTNYSEPTAAPVSQF